jgi:hypothetical protein
LNDVVEIPDLRLEKKVKSIQMFHTPVKAARQVNQWSCCYLLLLLLLLLLLQLLLHCHGMHVRWLVLPASFRMFSPVLFENFLMFPTAIIPRVIAWGCAWPG